MSEPDKNIHYASALMKEILTKKVPHTVFEMGVWKEARKLINLEPELFKEMPL